MRVVEVPDEGVVGSVQVLRGTEKAANLGMALSVEDAYISSKWQGWPRACWAIKLEASRPFDDNM